MISSEQFSPPSTLSDLQDELAKVHEQLVINDENENIVERTFRREEIQDDESYLLSAIRTLLSQEAD